MVNIDKVTSGFDAEIVLGEAFFSGIIRTFYESKIIPFRWSTNVAGGTFAIEIIPNLDVTLSGRMPVLAKTGFDIKLTSPLGTLTLRKIEITLAFSFTGRQGDNGLIDGIDLTIAFNNLGTGWDQNMPANWRPYRNDVRDLLRNNLVYTTSTGLSGGTVQNFAVRAYRETSTHTGAVGLYVTYPFVKKPEGTLFAQRGNANNAQCLLPSKQQSVAVALNPAIYEMLGTHMKNEFAEKQKSGKYSFPIYKNPKFQAGKMGTIKSIGFLPGDALPYGGRGNALFIFAHARGKQGMFRADVDIRAKVEPILTDTGLLGFDVRVENVEVDVDWDIFLAPFFIIGGLFSFIGAVTGGFLGMAIVGGFYGGLTLSAEIIGVEVGEEIIKDSLQDTLDPQVKPLRAIPRQVTIVPKRDDPFYITNYQVITRFDSCDIKEDSITACGNFSDTTTTDEIYPTIKIVDVIRTKKGKIVDLVYEVGNPNDIVNPERFRRPEGNPSGQFLLTIAEAKTRIKQDHLKSTPIVTPKRVHLANNQIKYLKMDSGVVLTPQETGELQVATILGVTGYKMVYMKRKKRFYFRSKRDGTLINNLAHKKSFKYVPTVKA